MDPLTIGMLVILAVLVFFMFRNSRKRKAQQEELRSAIVPGKEVMTNFGMFGTLKSIDEVTNEAELEIAKGVVIKVHRQTIAKVVDPTVVDSAAPRSVEEAMAIANREAEERETKGIELNKDSAVPLGEPAYGERVTPEVKKPVRRTTKKAGE
ncbi:MAG: preprotein translocase subunit YajC [Rhodoglobus sp.]|nr:preprotein translocase subunit YajC [Rhodoglobus sp.]